MDVMSSAHRRSASRASHNAAQRSLKRFQPGRASSEAGDLLVKQCRNLHCCDLTGASGDAVQHPKFAFVPVDGLTFGLYAQCFDVV